MNETLIWVRPTRSMTDHRTRSRSDVSALCGVAVDPSALWSSKTRRPCRSCSESARTDVLAGHIEAILEMMTQKPSLLENRPSFRVGPADFDGAVPYVSELLELLPEDDGTVYLGFLPSQVRWPIDVRLLVIDRDRQDGSMGAVKFKGLPAATVRGRISPSLPYATLYAGWFMRDRRIDTAVLGHAGPRRWVNVSTRYDPRDRLVDGMDMSTQMQLAMGLKQIHRARWMVYLSNGGLGISLATDAVGAKEVFRLRDIPDGRARRSALRHWVSEHWRLDVRDVNEELLVREHLRGQRDFSWSGLQCRITPSDLDFAREYRAIIEREQARIEGTDRRPIVEE